MLYRTTINGMISQWAHLCITFIMVFLAVALLILLIDTLTEFFLFMKDLKMEKQEVKKNTKIMMAIHILRALVEGCIRKYCQKT